ncbi:MAG TPA: FAD-dependent oxidoreductase [Candidatus Omnitrophota bacterium]|nr:FAD-dependent oxidoreductase [Candidatus Omnitrophota bacterium]
MKNNKTSMNVQPATKRIKNFSEAVLSFNKKQAMLQAQRCPQCSQPECVKACPLGVDIPGFIRLIREGDLAKALQKLREDNSLTGICGRLCEAPCEKACIFSKDGGQPIAIKSLERAAFDLGNVRLQEIFNAQASNKSAKKVAVIGSGPAGLMAAANLIEDGHSVTVFDALDKNGGMLRYAACDFHLPRKVLDAEIDYVRSLGTAYVHNTLIGQEQMITEFLLNDFQAVLIATGLGFETGAQAADRSIKGVITGQELLFRVNFLSSYEPAKAVLPFLGQKVIVMGNSLDAMECGRLLLRLGKKVTFVHEGSDDELPFPEEEKILAQEEGLTWEGFAKVVDITQDKTGAVAGVRCARLDFADQDGDWILMPVKDSDFIIDADTVVICGLYEANTSFTRLGGGLKVNKQGCLAVKRDQCATNLKGVFAAGGVTQGVMPLVQALAQGKKAAREIDEYLQKA